MIWLRLFMEFGRDRSNLYISVVKILRERPLQRITHLSNGENILICMYYGKLLIDVGFLHGYSGQIMGRQFWGRSRMPRYRIG